ncbi:hypothetical protein CPB85DRAFT_1279359 [Mucidula mucida]|nr:hypothetical protein CPB85DRAFT_1279359 [Mucidula mucida]
MSHPRHIANGVLNFRLGYNLQRPYPGRWTTPIVCSVFVGLTILLAITLKIGDTIQTNLSAFDYQIATAYRNELPSKAVASFPYYNNALSTCDVANLTLSVRKEERVSISASIGCWLPIMYTMTIELNHEALDGRVF